MGNLRISERYRERPLSLLKAGKVRKAVVAISFNPRTSLGTPYPSDTRIGAFPCGLPSSMGISLANRGRGIPE
jgi:hypothetical protein